MTATPSLTHALWSAFIALVLPLTVFLLLLQPLVDATTVKPDVTDTSLRPTYALPRRSASLLSTVGSAASECGAMSGAWQAHYGDTKTTTRVQVFDGVECVLLAVRMATNNFPYSYRTTAMDVLGIDSVTGRVIWTIHYNVTLTPQFDNANAQMIWLDGINQRMYVSGVDLPAKQRCTWVAAYTYKRDAPALLGRSQHCTPTSSVHDSDTFISQLHVWGWSDSAIDGAPIALVEGTGIRGWSGYGWQYSNVTITMYGGATGRQIARFNLKRPQPITFTACDVYDEDSDRMRFAWYEDNQSDVSGAAAVYEVSHDGSVVQLGRTYEWKETELRFVWRMLNTDASCVVVREWSQTGSYTVHDIASGALLWANQTLADTAMVHPLNSSLLVLGSVGGSVPDWATVAYMDVRTGQLVALSPTVDYGRTDPMSSEGPILQFDLSGVLYAEYHIQWRNGGRSDTWRVLDARTLQLINTGPTFGYTRRDGFNTAVCQ